MPAVTKNSAAEYIDLFIVPTDEQVRLPVTAAHNHYKQWAKSHDKPVIPKRHFSAMLAKRYRKSIHNGLSSFHCVKVKGAELHVTPMKIKTALGFNTPLEVLRAFLEKFNRPKVTSNELWPAYKSFCLERDIEPLKRETLGRVLMTLGVRKYRAKAGWTYILEGIQ